MQACDVSGEALSWQRLVFPAVVSLPVASQGGREASGEIRSCVSVDFSIGFRPTFCLFLLCLRAWLYGLPLLYVCMFMGFAWFIIFQFGEKKTKKEVN